MNSKLYWDMNSKELQKATQAFDEPSVADNSRPLTAAERKRWARVRKKPGRPKVGDGFQRISFSIERKLLRQATRLAKRRGVSRSRLIAESLEAVLSESK